MPQNVFEFLPQRSFLQDDFIVSPSNIDAFRAVTAWPRLWENKCLIITGQKASGKTFLTKVWQEMSSAKFINIDATEKLFQGNKPENIILEDIETLLPEKEEQIFHLYNNVIHKQGSLLITSSKPLISLDIKTPDLRSRLSSCTVVNILPPDNELLKGLIFKQFSDMQVLIQPSVIDFLIPRIDRSFAGVTAVVEQINKAGLEAKRSITIPFVKEVLGL
jgi:chromosomal replication initiation ATPase DnaA